MLIDDLDATLTWLTPLGRVVLEESARALRSVIRDWAVLSGHRVGKYPESTDWHCIAAVDRWICIDPLRLGQRTPHITHLRVSRMISEREISVDVLEEGDLRPKGTGRTGLLDDVAASGQTLLTIAKMLRAQGHRVTAVSVVAATAQARDAVTTALPGIEWCQLYDAGSIPVHIRDAIPFLPFAGRRVAGIGKVTCATGEVEVRAAPFGFNGSLWRDMRRSRMIMQQAMISFQTIIANLQRALGRKPVVADLVMLSPRPVVTIVSPSSLGPQTPLDTLWRSPPMA